MFRDFFKNKIIGNLKKIDKNYLIIFIFAFFVMIPYVSTKMIQGDDYICHIANIFSLDHYMSIKKFKLFPSPIHPVLAHDFGYGNGIFYPQLSYILTTYIYILIKWFGGTILSSIKIFQFLVVLFSGIGMYEFMKTTFKNRYTSLVSSIIYMAAPYFVADIFIRMSYSEMVVFVFIPIVMKSITHLLNSEYKKFILYFVIGYCGMIFSHLVLTVFFTILLSFYMLLNIKIIFNRKTIFSFLVATIVVLAITSLFWVPMLEHKLFGNYIVFAENGMAELEKLTSKRLSIFSLVNGYPKKIAFNLSLVAIALIIYAVVNYESIKLKLNKKQRMIIFSITAFTIISFIISSEIINWNYVPEIFWLIQFPWRMSTFIAFGTSIIAGLSMLIVDNKYKKIILIIICVLCLKDAYYVVNNGKLQVVELPTYEEVYSLNNRAMGSRKEYLPVNAKENLDYLKKRSDDVLVKSGSANIKLLTNKTPYLKFEVNLDSQNQPVKLEIPRIFYLGYDIKLITIENNEESIEYYENKNGFVELEVKKSGTIVVDYKGTLSNKIANVVSLITILSFSTFMYISYKKNY